MYVEENDLTVFETIRTALLRTVHMTRTETLTAVAGLSARALGESSQSYRPYATGRSS